MKYSVLTYVFNNYEIVREIPCSDVNAEYILVTDDPKLQSSTWTIVFDERLAELSAFDKCYYVRFHPFEYVHTDICLKIDGSIKIKDNLAPIIDRFNKRNSDIAVMLNPVFNHLHEDYEYWSSKRDYPRECAEKCLSKLYELGYDPDYKGYYQLCFEIERRNKVTGELNDLTYQMLVELGGNGIIERFDQPIWSFLFNKYFSKKMKVMAVNEYLITFSRYFSWCWHNSTDVIPYKLSSVPPYLFNRRTKVEYFDFLHEKGNVKIKFKYYKRWIKMLKNKFLKFFCETVQ